MVNGIVSSMQYYASCKLQNQSVDSGELVCNVGLGLISGTLDGPGLRNEEEVVAKAAGKSILAY